MTEDRITWTGVLSKRSDEKKVCCWTKGRKYKWAVCDDCEQSEQGNREEAVYQDVKRPHQPRRKVAEQPRQLQATQQYRNVLKPSDAVAGGVVSQ